MFSLISQSTLSAGLVFSIALLVGASNLQAQPPGSIPDPFGPPTPTTREPEGRNAPKTDTNPQDDSPGISTAPRIELPPTYIRLFLLDGDIVSGELGNDSISIRTEFGTLAVPIQKIVRFEPGLNSYPKVIQQLSQLVEDLGSTKYEARQAAHKTLVAMGPRIQNELKQFKEEENAERKRHLDEIRKEIDKLVAELDEEEIENPNNRPWEREDKLVMDHFTAVGKILQTQFNVKGKYGDLSIQLSDIQKGTRPSGGKEPIQKSLSLDRKNFVQMQWKSTGITLEKGDSVTVTAKGTISLSPWGSNAVSNPNGMPQYGVMPNTPGIPFGAVVARIGKGKYFKVGDKKTFRADAKGKLEFGITMQANYIGPNYQFPGEYKLKVQIQPEGNE